MVSKRRHTKTATHILPEGRHQEYLNGDTQLTLNGDSLDLMNEQLLLIVDLYKFKLDIQVD